MIGDIKQNVIVEVTAKTAQAEREMTKLDRTAQQTSTDLTRVSKAMETIGLGAQAQVPRLQKMHDAFQGFTGKIGQGIGAIDDFAKSLGPWNQTIELGSKALKFATSGLDAYAKTSTEAAAEVEELKERLGGLKDAVLETTGAIVAGMLKRMDLIEDTKNAAAEFQKHLEGIDQSFAFQAFFAGIETGKNKGAIWRGDDETMDPRPIQNLTDAFNGFRSAINGVADSWDTRGSTLIDSLTAGMEKSADAAKKAAQEAARWRAEFAALQAKERRNYTDARQGPDSVSSGINTGLLEQDASIGGALDSFEQQRARFAEESTRGARYAESAGRRNDSYLEKFFGPIEEFDAYATAFGTLTVATQSAMSAWISGSESLGSAIKKGIGTALAGVASQMGVEALKHGAYAVGSLAFGDVAGASKHAQAAGLFAVGSIAAATAAKGFGGGGGGQGAGASGGAAAGGSGGGSSLADRATFGPGANAGGGKSSTVIVYTEAFVSGTPGVRRRMAQRALDTAGKGDHWQDS